MKIRQLIDLIEQQANAPLQLLLDRDILLGDRIHGDFTVDVDQDGTFYLFATLDKEHRP